MQITFSFDTSNKTDLDLLNKITDFAAQVQGAIKAQPEVAGNTGTTATGFNLSPEGSGVSGAGALGDPRADQPAPAPEKKTRAKKSAPAVEASAPEKPTLSQSEPAETADKTYTLDEVRAALQQFTAKSGVPAGIDLLKTFNAGRISELDADDYAAFVERCAA